MRINKYTKGEQDAANKAWLHELQNLIRKNALNPELSVRWLASKFFLSERQFSRKTRQLAGLSPKLMIRETKLQAAFQLLSSQEVTSVKGVAMALSFSDTKYFSRLFHQRFGLYPSKV